MNLVDFLNQPEYVQLDSEGGFTVSDERVLSEARIYEEIKLWRIQGQVRKTQVETAVIVYDTIDRLKGIMNDDSAPQQKRALAKAIYMALSKLYEYEFYINLAEPVVSKMFSDAKALGILIEPEIQAIRSAARYVSKPLENVTLEQLRALRYPPEYDLVSTSSQGGQIVSPDGDLISGNNDGFRFILTTRKAFVGNVSIRVMAKKQVNDTFVVQDSFPINISKEWEANTAYAHVFKRQTGLAGYRYFKFMYKGPFQGAFEAVTVERVV